MKLWLTKFRISAALDAGRPLPRSLRKKIDASPELQQFARLDSLLRPPPVRDAAMHDDVMRAVRASARPNPARRAPFPSWLAVSVPTLALATFGLWLAHPRPAPPPRLSFDAPLAVLDLGEKIPAAMPSEMMAPLTSEWAKVNHDVRNTTEIVASTFPFEIQ